MNQTGGQQKYPVGIDLGTTETVLAYVDENGNAIAWRNEDGQTLTPSAVSLGKELLVGDEAIATGSQIIDCFKRDMGKPFCETDFPDLQIPPEVLSGLVLEHMQKRAQASIGPIQDVVISVPAYFNAKRRLATHQAGRLAGLNVVSIINEPTAAAIGYAFQEGLLADKQSKRSILVYDFGGGTFDVTLLRLENGTFKTMATDGDVRLGGQDIDRRLAEYMAQQFEMEFRVDPRKTAKGNSDLLQTAREAKIALADTETHVANVSYEVKHKKIVLRQDIYNFLIEPFIERTLVTCEDVLFESANMKWKDVDTILLVGGTSQIPFVSQKLHEMTGMAPTSVSNPQDLVALGCALYAANLSEDHALDFEIANVNSHSLGIRGRDVDSGQPMSRVLVPRNTALPISVKKKFVTYKEDQRVVKLILLEGESENPDLCYEVGKYRVALEPGLPKGERIEVFCNYSDDGTIHVSARLRKNEQSEFLEIESSNRELEDLDTWRIRLQSGTSRAGADSNALFENEDAFNEDALFGGFSELEQLDQLYYALGQYLVEPEIPVAFRPQQRLAQALGLEIEKMGRLIDKLRIRIETLEEGMEKTELQSNLEELKVFEALKRKAHNQVVASLGRDCRRNSVLPYQGTELIEKVELLESKVLSIWT